jgi:hypothetical protein
VLLDCRLYHNTLATSKPMYFYHYDFQNFFRVLFYSFIVRFCIMLCVQTKGMGMLSLQQFSIIIFISHALHVSVIRPSQAGKHNMEKSSLTTDHLSYLPTSESLTEVSTKENTLLPTLFGNPYSYCCQTSIYYCPRQSFHLRLRYSVYVQFCASSRQIS